MLIYCDFKMFCLRTFNSELVLNVESKENNGYQTFQKNFVDTMNNQAPKKSKIFQSNQKPHINWILRNTITKYYKLKNKANKTKSVDDIIKYKKQQKLVVKFNKNCGKGFFGNSEIKKISKLFSNKCKAYFSNKQSKGSSDILLIEKDETDTKKLESC